MNKALTPIDEVKKNINLLSPQFKAALPPHVSVEKFVRTVITAVQTTPALVKANRQSLYAAAMKCASAGLLADGREAALVPFKDQVQFLPMVAGILKQVRNSGELSSITSQLVYKNDSFRYWIDSQGEHLEHEPQLFGDRGELLGVYALATLKDGAVYIEVMTDAQVQDVRNVSRAKDGPGWTGAFKGEFYRKTAVRRLSKRLPISTDKAPALDSENDDFDFDAVKEAKPKEEAPAKKGSRLQKLVAESAPPMQESGATVIEPEQSSPDLEVEANPDVEPEPDETAPI